MNGTPETPRFFPSAAEWEAWLETHGASEDHLLVGFYRAGASRQGTSYPEILDGALAFGWIDGVRRRLDDERWTSRFSPRKARSYWSAVNLAHFRRLASQGRVRPPGRAAFERRSRTTPGRYSYENRPRALPPRYLAVLRQDAAAWGFFRAQPPGYRRGAAFWVCTAKKEETRQRRLASLVAACQRSRRLSQLDLSVRPTGDESLGGALK